MDIISTLGFFQANQADAKIDILLNVIEQLAESNNNMVDGILRLQEELQRLKKRIVKLEKK